MTVDTAAMVVQWREAIARGGHRAYSIPVVEMVALLDALDVLTTALQWYADERNYDEHGVLIGRGAGPSTAGGIIQEAWTEPDCGERARAALATTGGEVTNG